MNIKRLHLRWFKETINHLLNENFMRLRIILLITTLFINNFLKAQVKNEINDQDGIYVTYELTKIEENSKKETYLAIIKAENKNDFDVFYSVPLTTQANGSKSVGILQSKGFSQIAVRNGTGFFGDYQTLVGTETNLITNDNFILFTIPKGKFVTGEKEFKVKKGVKPIITNTFLMPFKKLDLFDIAINETSISGEWISNCGGIQMSLSLGKNEKGETILQQSVNGKQNFWKKLNASLFEKINDKNVTLSFNKANNTFNYATTDGVACVWSKK